jgi:hypothetical protein
MQQHDLDMLGDYGGMDPMMQQQMRQVQMMRAQGLDPYAGMDIDQQEMMERQCVTRAHCTASAWHLSAASL